MNGYPLQQTTAFLDLRGVCRNRPKRLTEDFSSDLPSNFSRSNLYGESRETCVSRAKKSFWVENDDFLNFLKFRFPFFFGFIAQNSVERAHLCLFQCHKCKALDVSFHMRPLERNLKQIRAYTDHITETSLGKVILTALHRPHVTFGVRSRPHVRIFPPNFFWEYKIHSPTYCHSYLDFLFFTFPPILDPIKICLLRLTQLMSDQN